MNSDIVHPQNTDIPANVIPMQRSPKWAAQWEKESRGDPRFRPIHQAVIGAYARHCFRRDWLRGEVFVTPQRLQECTSYGRRAIGMARADLVAWGWLRVTRRNGRGTCTRYALDIAPPAPTGSTSGYDRCRYARRALLKPVDNKSGSARRAPQDGFRSARRAHDSLPRSLPTYPDSPKIQNSPPPAVIEQPGRQDQRPAEDQKDEKPPPATRDVVLAVLPPSLTNDTRTLGAMPRLTTRVTAALAAGWSQRQIRTELEGSEIGAKFPVAIVITRLDAICTRRPPSAPIPGPSAGDLNRLMAAAGGLCAHENPNVRMSNGLLRCPNCRRAEAAA